MLNVGGFVYSLLTNSIDLTALVSVDSISSSYPETVTVFPSVIFLDEQGDAEFVDNLPESSNASVTVHVFVRDDSPFAIANIICDLFKSNYWACTPNVDAPDPETAVRHRVMRFTRPLLPGDI